MRVITPLRCFALFCVAATTGLGLWVLIMTDDYRARGLLQLDTTSLVDDSDRLPWLHLMITVSMNRHIVLIGVILDFVALFIGGVDLLCVTVASLKVSVVPLFLAEFLYLLLTGGSFAVTFLYDTYLHEVCSVPLTIPPKDGEGDLNPTTKKALCPIAQTWFILHGVLLFFLIIIGYTSFAKICNSCGGERKVRSTDSDAPIVGRASDAGSAGSFPRSGATSMRSVRYELPGRAL